MPRYQSPFHRISHLATLLAQRNYPTNVVSLLPTTRNGRDSLEGTRECIKLLSLLDVRRTPKVNHLDVSLVVENDVLVLDIAMDDPVVVEEVDCFCDLCENASDGREGETRRMKVDVVE